ncbi:MAG: SDR family oxidoreductase [Halobacteriovoraceae bacterium]|nr:SDR family oxidoreductase [Halobacteriovoraceae bacterium]
MFQLENKHFFITGAAGILARSFISKLKKQGAYIVGSDRNENKLNILFEEKLIDEYIVGDLTDATFQENIIKKYASTTDVLINNVGMGFSKTLEDTTREDFYSLYKLNFETTAIFCQGFLPEMAKRKKGKVINFSSILADNPLPTLSAYCASKAAIIAFTKSVALQFCSSNIQANVVAPGYIENPKNEEYFRSNPGQDFSKRFMPTGSIGKLDSIDGAILYLSSELSNHMTGQVLKIDGGYSIW